MAYVLGTMQTTVRWYEFPVVVGSDFDTDLVGVLLHDSLDLSFVTQFRGKESAKYAAIKAGLKSWRYVRI